VNDRVIALESALDDLRSSVRELEARIAHLERRAQMGLRPGGFGILVTRQIVDEMFYNERGNEVLLVKRLA